ncbi:hypothetical protein Droror1_Dr00002311 [Drosera rotundifolia]
MKGRYERIGFGAEEEARGCKGGEGRAGRRLWWRRGRRRRLGEGEGGEEVWVRREKGGGWLGAEAGKRKGKEDCGRAHCFISSSQPLDEQQSNGPGWESN